MARRLAEAAVVVVWLAVACGGDDGDRGDVGPERGEGSTSTASEAVDTSSATRATPPANEVTAGPVTILTNEYGLPDTTGWDTAAVFDLTNNGDFITAASYRVRVSSTDGATTTASDGSDTVALTPGETATVVADGLDPTGPSAPTQGEVTVYGRSTAPAVALVGEPDWVSSNELFECDNGLVGCGITGDLTYNGASPFASPETIQVVAYRGEEIVAAGHTTTQQLDVTPGQTVPYEGQIAAAAGFDGTDVTDVAVRVEQFTEGD
jgi:hypothetical protein